MGPSGSGKTTFLRCLNGLELADRGSVVVGQTSLRAQDSIRDKHAAVQRLRQQVGFVFQGCHLFSHRTVLENVMEGPVFVQRRSPDSVMPDALALLEKVGVAHRKHAYPRELSGGEQQRTAIARALALTPRILLLDEPTSALDADRGDDLAALLRGLIAEGLAVLTVTHDADFAKTLGARVVAFSGGRLTAQ
jgi:ABC-type polar amino acid transport system ATPase subunit